MSEVIFLPLKIFPSRKAAASQFSDGEFFLKCKSFEIWMIPHLQCSKEFLRISQIEKEEKKFNWKLEEDLLNMWGCPEWVGWWCPEVRDRKTLKFEEAVWMPVGGCIVRAEIILAAALLIMEKTKEQVSALFWLQEITERETERWSCCHVARSKIAVSLGVF